MKRAMILAAVLMTAATAVQATPALTAWVTYPTVTTWRLYGQVVDNTGGLASFAITVSGIDTKLCMAPVQDVYDGLGNYLYTAGFAFGNDVLLDSDTGKWQLFKYQNTALPESLIYGVGVGAPVLLYQGKRDNGADMPIDYAGSQANLLAGVGQTAAINVPVIPEPAALTLLALGGLGLTRRRG